jgi:CspA family cold shock protein
MSEERVSGIVKWFNAERGYGFVLRDGDEQNEYFVHYSYIQMDGYKTVRAGQKVTFTLVETDKGIQAQEVIPE